MTKTKTKKQKRQYTTYAEATKDLKLILCNQVRNFELSDYSYRLEDYINEELIEDVYNRYDDCTEEDKQEILREKATEKFYDDYIFQYYLTDLYLNQVEYLTAKYGLKFGYSEDLDLWVLLVTTFGICWEGVKVEVKEVNKY